MPMTPRALTPRRLATLLLLAATSMLAACTGNGGGGGDMLADTDDVAETSAPDVADTASADDTAQPQDTEPDLQDDTSEPDTTAPDLADDTVAQDTVAPDTADAVDEDVLVCEPDHEDCDGDATNGCEPLSSLEHCGTCGNDCTGLFADAQASCEAGTCTLAACDDTFGDCDDDPTNGCETAWGPVGGRCCAGGGLSLDVAGLITRDPNQGVWAIYKNGGALAEDLRCGEDWDTPEARAALDKSNFPVDIVWRRNCSSASTNNGMREWYESGQTRDMLFLVYGDDGGEIWRGAVGAVVDSFVHLPAGETCTELEQVTLRLLY